MRTICVIGTGYVGLVTGVCLADMGNQVQCIDIDPRKIAALQKGQAPIYEPGLQDLLERNLRAGRISFTEQYPVGLANAEFVFIAVNTPEARDHGADMTNVRAAARAIAEHLDHDAIIVNKSTMPVGSGDLVQSIIASHLARPSVHFSVVSNPEFLAQGAAVRDFQRPDRIVLGSADREAAGRVAELYLPLRAPIMLTDLYTAEMIKYASNAFLAAKISFINEIARICERLGADVKEVAAGMSYDHRIGSYHLEAGVGFGGSCFGKDVQALAHMATQAGLHPQLLYSILEINQDQRRMLVDHLITLLGAVRGKTVAVLGLAFKPNTDDLRDAPAIDIIQSLRAQGAEIRACDPVANERTRALLGEDQITYWQTAYEAIDGADAVMIITHWNEFRGLDLDRVRGLLRRPIVIDGRNCYNPLDMAKAGLIYRGVGRGQTAALESSLPTPLAAISHASGVATMDLAPRESADIAQPVMGE